MLLFCFVLYFVLFVDVFVLDVDSRTSHNLVFHLSPKSGMKPFLVDQGADTTMVNSGTDQNCLNLFGRLIAVCLTPAV